MVTHDRYFLDRVCTKMIELDQGDLYIHNGNYEVYLENKETRIEQEKLAAHKHKNLYKKELEWVRAGVQRVAQNLIVDFKGLKNCVRNVLNSKKSH